MSALPEKTFHIVRQDSNGNHFLERESISEKLADEFLKARAEDIGDHHQTIWKQEFFSAATHSDPSVIVVDFELRTVSMQE